MSPVPFSKSGSFYPAPQKSADSKRSYSEPPERSLGSSNGFTDLKSKIPLEDATIHHLRQAIKTQAEGIAYPFRFSGSKTVWFRKRITTPALKRATALIIIHLNDVLDLELKEESMYNRAPAKNPHYQESDWQYAPLSHNENTARNSVQQTHEDILEEKLEAPESEDNEVSKISYNSLSDKDQNSENEPESNLEGYAASQAPNNSGQKSQTDLDVITGLSVGQISLASPPPSQEQEPPKTPSRKAGLFSRLVPSRLSSLFMPTPPPSSQVKSPPPATPSTPPPAVQPIDFDRRRSSKTPDVSPSPIPDVVVSPVGSNHRRSEKTPPTSPPAIPPANAYNRRSRKISELSSSPTPALAIQPANIPNLRSTKTPERSPPLVSTPAIESANAYHHRSRKAPASSTPPTPTPAVQPANIYNRRSAKTPELSPTPEITPATQPANVSDPPSRKTPDPPHSTSPSSPSLIIPQPKPPAEPLLSSSLSSSSDSTSESDELLTPLVPSIIIPHQTTPTQTQTQALNRKARTRPSAPTRRSTRTIKPRTSARVAQMIPPNLRTAGSWGPYKTLPGPRVGGGERGRSVGRNVGQKRSGSASSVSSAGSVRGGGGGGGGGKR
ncbi:MAG: hypothetical protein Q9216_004069, partial [Gyalolechia sp. 2 TL-2023]